MIGIGMFANIIPINILQVVNERFCIESRIVTNLSFVVLLMQTVIHISVTGNVRLPSFSSVDVSIPAKLITTLFVLYRLKFNTFKSVLREREKEL